jgi:hypothetical protein
MRQDEFGELSDAVFPEFQPFGANSKLRGKLTYRSHRCATLAALDATDVRDGDPRLSEVRL